MNMESDTFYISESSLLAPRINGIYAQLIELGFDVMLSEDEHGMPFLVVNRGERQPITIVYRYEGDEELFRYFLVALAQVDVKGMEAERLNLWNLKLKLAHIKPSGKNTLLLCASLPEYGGISDPKNLQFFLREFSAELDSL